MINQKTQESTEIENNFEDCQETSSDISFLWNLKCQRLYTKLMFEATEQKLVFNRLTMP